MSWNPNDLVADVDLLAYEPTILTQFGRQDWTEKRAKALEDWLWPALIARGFDPDRLRTRVAPTAVVGVTSSVATDVTTAATDATADDVALGAILASASDALYVGCARPFRGLSLRMADDVSSATVAAQVAIWQDAWTPVGVKDGTRGESGSGPSFRQGGAITWTVPGGWVTRTLYDVDTPLYWARLTATAALSAGATVSQIGAIRRSLFCAPVTYKTLEWIFRAAPTSQEGPWDGRADFYAEMAASALSRALDHAGGEFDTVTEDDVVDATEAAQTATSAGGGPWTWERA